MVIAAHHVSPVSNEVQNSAPLRGAVRARTLIILHASNCVGAFASNGFGGERLVALERAELVVLVVFAAVRAVFQIRDGALYGVEVDFSVPVGFAWLRVQPRVREEKSHPKVAALGVAYDEQVVWHLIMERGW